MIANKEYGFFTHLCYIHWYFLIYWNKETQLEADISNNIPATTYSVHFYELLGIYKTCLSICVV